MSERPTRRREEMKRLQIGAFGLAIVLLLVTMASIMRDGASNETPVTDTLAEEQRNAIEAGAVLDAPKEPLAELGVTPAPDEKAKLPEGPPAAGNKGPN